jgi:polygalacturonase
MSGGIRNVAVSNCVFDGTEIGIRFKSMRGRGGIVENLSYDNIMMTRVKEPLILDLQYWKKTDPGPVTEWTPRFRNIRISGVGAVGAVNAGVIVGIEELPIENLWISESRFEAEQPLIIRNVSGLLLNNIEIACPVSPSVQMENVVTHSGSELVSCGVEPCATPK